MTTIEWQDLLRVPFKANGDDPADGLDCWGQAREIARRAGLTFPDLGERPTPGNAAHLTAFKMLGARWTALSQVGDLLLSDPTGRGHVSHVSTVVDAERGIVLSTSSVAGPYAWPAHRAPCALGVWRIA